MSLFDDFDEDFADGSSEDAGDDFDYSMDDEFDQFRTDDDDAFGSSDEESVSRSGGGVAGYLGQFTAGQRLILAFLLLIDVIAVSGALMVLTGVI